MLWCAICALQCFVVQVELSLFQAFYPSLYLHRVGIVQDIVQDIVQETVQGLCYVEARCDMWPDARLRWMGRLPETINTPSAKYTC